MPIIFGSVSNLSSGTPSAAAGTNNQVAQGSQSELLVNEIAGKYYNNNRNSQLFFASVAAQTIPVTTVSVVSVYTLYNPPGSGINMELVQVEVGIVVAATVVSSMGFYFATAANSAAGVFSTLGTVRSSNLAGATGKGQFYSAYTHNAVAPIVADLVYSINTTTAVNFGPIRKNYDGTLVVSPGIALSFLASTAASTGSSVSISTTWAERPL